MNTPQSPFAEAIGRLQRSFQEARQREYTDPFSASLASASSNARPAVRMVSVIAIDDFGPVFFTDRRSGKGRQLSENPLAGLCFYWPELAQQIVVEGPVEALRATEADQHWSKRPHEHRLAAWVEDTSPPPGEADTVEARLRAVRQRFADEPAPRPPDWHAIRLTPDLFLFWKLGWRRLHTRQRYYQGGDGRWYTDAESPL